MKKVFVLFFALACFFSFSQDSSAYSVTLTDFEGREAEALVNITGDGTNEITFEIELVDTIADIRGFFFNVEGFFSNLSVSGADITAVDSSGNVSNMGGGVNMNGTGESFDIGLSFGTQGIGTDDINTTSFTLFNDEALSIGDLFGARLTSVGEDREGSRKLLGSFEDEDLAPAPVPEPGTMLLLGAGIIGLLGLGRSRRKNG